MTAATIEPIRIPAESELAVRLRAAAATGARLRVVTDEASYTLDVADDATASTRSSERPKPTPEEVERSIQGIRDAAGSWADIDAEAFKAYIRERRRTPSRPHPWPNE